MPRQLTGMARNLDGRPRWRHGHKKDREVTRRRQTMSSGRAKVAFRCGPLEHLIVPPAHNNFDSRVRSKRGSAEPSLCQSRNENSSGLVLSSMANGNIGKSSTAKLQWIFIQNFVAADIKRKVEHAVRATD